MPAKAPDAIAAVPNRANSNFFILFLRLVKFFSTNFELQAIWSQESITKFSILSEWYCGQTVQFFQFVLVVVLVLDFFVCSFFRLQTIFGLYGLSCR